MENIVITWRELLIVVVLILAVYIAEMLLLMRTGGGLLHKRRMPDAEQDNRSTTELHADIEQLTQRIDALEKQIVKMHAENLQESSPYNRAIQMARQGRDAVRISESCGISRGEAELIVSMHGTHE